MTTEVQYNKNKTKTTDITVPGEKSDDPMFVSMLTCPMIQCLSVSMMTCPMIQCLYLSNPGSVSVIEGLPMKTPSRFFLFSPIFLSEWLWIRRRRRNNDYRAGNVVDRRILSGWLFKHTTRMKWRFWTRRTRCIFLQHLLLVLLVVLSPTRSFHSSKQKRFTRRQGCRSWLKQKEKTQTLVPILPSSAPKSSLSLHGIYLHRLGLLSLDRAFSGYDCRTTVPRIPGEKNMSYNRLPETCCLRNLL